MDDRDEGLDCKWAELYARAKIVLDDEGEAQETKRKGIALKKLKRAGLDAPPVDIGRVKRALLAYAETKRYTRSLKSVGASKEEMNLAYDLWPESKTVYEYVQRMRDEERSQDMEEVSDIAAEKLKKLLEDDNGKCLVNAKLVMQTLERLDRKRFLVDNSGGGAASKGASSDPLVYQISNVQMNLVGNDVLRAALPAGGVVDVEAVVKALDVRADG